MPVIVPYIPQSITVHLGAPDDSAANVTVSFPEYIKNVASSEIYPTWNESAILANIYAQISFALNRVYTEFYRSRGYDFTITSTTAYDQKFIQGRNIFENIDRIVDEVFTTYIRRIGTLEPLFAQFCNGRTVTCKGMSQWGSQELAEQGYNSVEILKYYYGDDIELVTQGEVKDIVMSYPGTPVRLGDSGINVQVVQTMLNRISQNYPAIPKINPADGIFGEYTKSSVVAFQEIFNLTPDGIVGIATWYKMVYLYVGVTKLSELESEGQTIFGSSLYPFSAETSAAAVIASDSAENNYIQETGTVSEGDTGESVRLIQYYIDVISAFNPEVPYVDISGTYDTDTANAVSAFQRTVNLRQTGITDAATFNALYRQYYGNNDVILSDKELFPVSTLPYGGQVLYVGSSGKQVAALQEYLNVISIYQTGSASIGVTGNFGRQTVQSVIAYQRSNNLPVTGRADRETWNSIANTYKDIRSASTTRATQFPGKNLKLGDTDINE